jgi:hypothetical protein
MSLKKETIETRLDNIEEVLKMLLVNSVLGSSDIEKIQENILCQCRNTLSGLGIYNVRMNYIENKYYIFAEIDANETLKNIKNCYAQACELLDDIKLVFVFEKLHAKRKKALEDAGVSYYLQNGEMRIF